MIRFDIFNMSHENRIRNIFYIAFVSQQYAYRIVDYPILFFEHRNNQWESYFFRVTDESFGSNSPLAREKTFVDYIDEEKIIDYIFYKKNNEYDLRFHNFYDRNKYNLERRFNELYTEKDSVPILKSRFFIFNNDDDNVINQRALNAAQNFAEKYSSEFNGAVYKLTDTVFDDKQSAKSFLDESCQIGWVRFKHFFDKNQKILDYTSKIYSHTMKLAELEELPDNRKTRHKLAYDRNAINNFENKIQTIKKNPDYVLKVMVRIQSVVEK